MKFYKLFNMNIRNPILIVIFITIISAAFGCKSGNNMKEEVDNTPIGVQLYCVRTACEEDLPGTLQQLSKIGFDGVEFADYFGYSAIELKTMLDEANLQSCGTHIYLEDLMGDKFDETVNFNKILGNKYLIIRWLVKENFTTKQSWIELSNVLNQISDRLKPYEMKLGYHNHGFEFEPVEGEIPWNILADNTNKDIVLQMDTGNASLAGIDPLFYLERNPGRSATSHLKPYSSSNDSAFIGEDEIDWKSAINIYKNAGGIKWFIVEYEVELEDKTPMQAIKVNYDNLKKILADN